MDRIFIFTCHFRWLASGGHIQEAHAVKRFHRASRLGFSFSYSVRLSSQVLVRLSRRCPFWVRTVQETRCPLYPPKADMVQRDRHVRLVPQEDVDPAYSITSSVADQRVDLMSPLPSKSTHFYGLMCWRGPHALYT